MTTENRPELTQQQDGALHRALEKYSREEIAQAYFTGADQDFFLIAIRNFFNAENLLSAMYSPNGWIVIPDTLHVTIDRKMRAAIVRAAQKRNTAEWETSLVYAYQAGVEAVLEILGIEFTPTEKIKAGEAYYE